MASSSNLSRTEVWLGERGWVRVDPITAVAPERISWDSPTRVGYRLSQDLENDDPDSDVYVVRVRRCVSVTPLSLDMTSRIDLNELDRLLRA